MWPIILLILLSSNSLNSVFIPDTSDYDAYGLKIAANDVLFVQANGDQSQYLIQYAPYDSTQMLQCQISYYDSAHYIYSVGVGARQTATNQSFFYFSGEVAPKDGSGVDRYRNNGTFIGVLLNADPNGLLYYTNSAGPGPSSSPPLSCNYFQYSRLVFLPTVAHQEYFVMAIEPDGQYAIGLATDFIIRFQPFPTLIMQNITTNPIWPNNATFYPCAADASDTFTVVAGFLANTGRTRVAATPTIYTISNTNLSVLATWSYTATNMSWQSRLTYSGISTWSSKLTMSVKINPNDSTLVLVGMPFLNTVFLCTVDSNGGTLQCNSSTSNGVSVGFGKSVSWLTQSQAAFLVSTYSSDYNTWLSSQVFVYTSMNGTSIPDVPAAVIPNAQQPLPSTINAEWIRMVSTPSSVAVLDISGGSIIILTSQAGLYSSTDTSNSPVAASMPVVSHSVNCIGGTYKPDAGIHPCTICPVGTLNLGNAPATICTNCSGNGYCPLGALYETNNTDLTDISQAYAYPKSPEISVFEDLLLYNMFSLSWDAHCLHVSPIFWTLILLAIVIVLLLAMASMNLCVQEEKRTQWRKNIKRVFLRTDLVGEGELWLGGLASLAIILITGMAYGFAISFLYQYPSEKVGPSNFACDTTIRNAKFQSNLQALAVPVSDTEKTIFSMLNQQNFTLNVDFLNTAMDCMKISAYEIIETATIDLPPPSCVSSNGTLSMSMQLNQHDITVQIVLSDILLIGGFRMGLSGSGQTQDLSTLQNLSFRQVFTGDNNGTLAQKSTVTLYMTKVVNETESLSDGDSEYAGIWYPTFSYSVDDMFLDAYSYMKWSNYSYTTVTFVISETSYYIQNVQAPIAKQPEVIFRTLLFSFMCLEVCAMAFIIAKLIIIPCYQKIITMFGRRSGAVVDVEHHEKSAYH